MTDAQHVVEIDEALLATLVLIAGIDGGGGLVGDWRFAPGSLCRVGVGLGFDHAGFGPFDLGDEVDTGRGLFRTGEQTNDKPRLASHELWGSDVAFCPAGAQLRVGNGVERAGGYLFTEAE